MKRFSSVVCGLSMFLWMSATLAVNVDRTTVKISVIEPPLVNAAAIDFSGVMAEAAFGDIRLGEAVLKTTKSWCVPKGSENAFKDAVEIPTHYYEIPYETESGVVVIRGAGGQILHTDRLADFSSSERFGYGECRYWFKKNLEDDFAGKSFSITKSIEQGVAEYFEAAAKRSMNDVLFFNVLNERVPVYRFKARKHDYTDLDRAFELARQGYRQGPAGHADLEQALAIWQAALSESDLNDKEARINRKVSVRLYESVGIAQLTLGDLTAAVKNLDKARRYTSMTTARSGGTGSADLMQRARERKLRNSRNPDLPVDPEELDQLISATEAYRGRIPVHLLPSSELERLKADHAAQSVGGVVGTYVAEANEQQEAIDAGLENPYERQVGSTAVQGFYLFLMPYGNKLTEFPEEIVELTYLNQLRMPKHGFSTVPDSIGNLAELRLLDLSGNNIQRLPDSIQNLTSLKTLKIKDNPLAPGELERLKTLLPKCKIKS